MGNWFERWQDGWKHLFLMGAGIGLAVAVPAVIALPYYLAYDLWASRPAWLPHPFWAWATAFVGTAPHWATLAARAFWPSRP